MRIVVAPDRFKGSLTALQAAGAIGEGLRRSRPRLMPVSRYVLGDHHVGPTTEQGAAL